ncbi:unnamed protein product [Allacma fusca]|uniref:MITD1 C-terminal phospholipase D-like domain-containing protein n=1 Tax=Allacma fusca TaxID=39272 RepID=A0A8J2LNJ7_9HEXA|nr:unnamed protein product [Allacma fusca]
MLIEAIKLIPEELTKSKIRVKVEEYMIRAEKLKKHIESLKSEGNYREQIQIKEDSVGHSYDNIFSRFLDTNVTTVQVDDPYIRSVHQCDNFVRFVELVLKKCPNVTSVRLNTGKDDDFGNQQKRLDSIAKSCMNIQGRHLLLGIQYSDSLHDREIRFDNGWVVKIGRGLDFFKPKDRYTVGFTDFDFRPCKETTVDIFHRKELTKVR